MMSRAVVVGVGVVVVFSQLAHMKRRGSLEGESGQSTRGTTEGREESKGEGTHELMMDGWERDGWQEQRSLG